LALTKSRKKKKGLGERRDCTFGVPRQEQNNREYQRGTRAELKGPNSPRRTSAKEGLKLRGLLRQTRSGDQKRDENEGRNVRGTGAEGFTQRRELNKAGGEDEDLFSEEHGKQLGKQKLWSTGTKSEKFEKGLDVSSTGSPWFSRKSVSVGPRAYDKNNSTRSPQTGPNGKKNHVRYGETGIQRTKNLERGSGFNRGPWTAYGLGILRKPGKLNRKHVRPHWGSKTK